MKRRNLCADRLELLAVRAEQRGKGRGHFVRGSRRQAGCRGRDGRRSLVDRRADPGQIGSRRCQYRRLREYVRQTPSLLVDGAHNPPVEPIR